ncbi:helix-turn-helix domain-containing protein [Clostridium coskatii]|uniref:HTH cro/C1-type domain-containing protein n=1 Tax=Clostridium coskatii TaxID=1705578 RepID=A0A162LG20_9CLOT|nr:helix-turn-helix domain-containing protein [Clostridium coskatii]OAA93046.1 hypothetical protein WX73_00364 [Clostridium coskatii]OBR90789.1 hypothetical protein CLCOS_37640 [Clostridium coskatii]
MFRSNLLKAQMALHGYTITKLASEIGITPKTLSVKLNHSPEKFTQKEMESIVNVLKIKNPAQIFFSHELRDTQQEVS